jgi:hypothetical protein
MIPAAAAALAAGVVIAVFHWMPADRPEPRPTASPDREAPRPVAGAPEEEAMAVEVAPASPREEEREVAATPAEGAGAPKEAATVAPGPVDVRPSPSEKTGPDGAAPAEPPSIVASRVAGEEKEREPREESGAGPAVRVAAARGALEYSRAGSSRWFRAMEGTRLLPGDRLRTRLARARLEFESGTQVFVNQFTAASIGRETKPPGVSVTRGEVYAETVPADKGFHISSPHGRAVDLGTRFGLRAEAARTTVGVVEGRVEASTRAGRAEIKSGQEVVLAALDRPPGPVRDRGALAERYAWARELREEDGALARRRATRALVVLYTFREGAGGVVHDVSETGRPLDLAVEDESAVRWIEGGGLEVRAATLLASPAPASKIVEACRATNEITIEAWVRPSRVPAQVLSPARIVTVSTGQRTRNFTLGMDGHGEAPYYSVRLRTTATDDNGYPHPTSAFGSARTELSHVVYARDASGANRFYVDGEPAPGMTDLGIYKYTGWRDRIGGDFSNWDGSLRLALANEIAERRPWLGEFHLVAVYNRALSGPEIEASFALGPGTSSPEGAR